MYIHDNGNSLELDMLNNSLVTDKCQLLKKMMYLTYQMLYQPNNKEILF